MVGKTSGEAVMILIMGVMMVGGVILWLTRGDFHMMPMHGNGNSHMNAKTDSSSHDTRGGVPDPHHGAEEPVLDNP